MYFTKCILLFIIIYHSFRFASVFGKILTDLVTDGQTTFDLKPFTLDRPALTDPTFEPQVNISKFEKRTQTNEISKLWINIEVLKVLKVQSWICLKDMDTFGNIVKDQSSHLVYLTWCISTYYAQNNRPMKILTQLVVKVTR